MIRASPAPGARDIYFMVFDRYGSDDSLRDLADIDNDLTGWLGQQGFGVAPDALANYGRTTMSLAATLNMTYLDGVVAKAGPGSNDTSAVNEMLQDHEVGRFLQERGYRYIHIGNWFGPTKTASIADENPQMPGSSDFLELLDSTTLSSTIDFMRGLPPNHNRLHRAAALYDLTEFDRVRTEPGPKFVMLHMLLPHEPYVFAADGSDSGLTGEDAKLSPKGLRDQLQFTNDNIRRMVTELLDVPEAARPIIILEADEGPYPTRFALDPDGFDWHDATPEELETKYGVLMGIYLPGDAPAGAPQLYPDMSLVNTFPLVFDRYFDAGIPMLPDRSYTSESWHLPFDLTDVTDLLGSS